MFETILVIPCAHPLSQSRSRYRILKCRHEYASLQPCDYILADYPLLPRQDLSNLTPATHLSWGDHNVKSSLAQPLSPEQLSQAAADAKRIRVRERPLSLVLRPLSLAAADAKRIRVSERPLSLVYLGSPI